MSLQDRAAALHALRARKAKYLDGPPHLYRRYNIPTPQQYCEQRKHDADADLRDAAVNMLRFLAGDTLLRPSQRSDDHEQLLRGAAQEPHNGTPHELMRAAESPDTLAKPPYGFWERLRRRW